MSTVDATAACTFSNHFVTCNTTVTVDTNYPTNLATGTDRHYIGALGANLEGFVQGAGFALSAPLLQPVTVTNSNVVIGMGAAPTAGGDGLVRINGQAALMTYTGLANTTINAAAGGPALVITNIDNFTTTGAVSVNNAGMILASGSPGVQIRTAGGATNVVNSAQIQGSIGVDAQASGAGDITINSTGSVQASSGVALNAQSHGGNVLITNSGFMFGGIRAATTGSGTVTVVNSSGVNATPAVATSAEAGSTTITFNTGSIAPGSPQISAVSTSGDITIQGNGILASAPGTLLEATSTSGNIRVTGLEVQGGISALSTSGTVGITARSTTNTYTTGGAVTAVLPQGTINALSASGVNLTNATSFVTLVNNTTITNTGNAVTGSAAAASAFGFANNGIINGNVSVTGSNVASSLFNNAGTWNLAATGNSTFSGNLSNGGTIATNNSLAGQIVTIGGNYSGTGAYVIDLGDRISASGSATLSGTNATVRHPGGAVGQDIVIFHAGGGFNGTNFASVTMPGFNVSVTYLAFDVLLNVGAATLGAGQNLNQDDGELAQTLNAFFNGGGALPPGFGVLFGLTGSALTNALAQVSGEVATGIQPSANLSMGLFLNAMIDPFVTGRTGGFGSGMNYAPETPSRVEVAAREAFAAGMPVKARPPMATFEQRWSMWGAAYGGQQRTDGETIVGSSDLRATAAGFAAGLDYRVSRDTVMGMAVAVGQTRWNVAAPALGKGHSDVGQVGGYASTRWDNLYLSGAIAFAWHRAETERTVTVAGTDNLAADFDATSIGGRLEGGYRHGGVQFGLTPYAAVQVRSLRTPNYTEYATGGSNQFAVTFASQTTTDTRSELGVWADTRFPFADNTIVLRGRAAWVHDFNPGSRIRGAFFTLPGTSLVIDGAPAPRDAALTSAVAEMRLRSGWTLISKFDGEFSGRSQTLAGTGTARYTW